MHNVKGMKGITKHRLYELKYFCLQYGQWRRALRGRITDEARADYEEKCRIVEETAQEAGGEIARWILEAVTKNDVTYNTLRARGIPCGKDYFYERRRKFYMLLHRKKF